MTRRFRWRGRGSPPGSWGLWGGRTDLLPKGGDELFLPHRRRTRCRPGNAWSPFAAGENYPSGLLVGTVRQIVDDPGGLTRAAIVEPAADLNNLGQVFAVTDFWEVR
ncbi:MAG: rod shape-determining protein MreC [Evtepia sp.]